MEMQCEGEGRVEESLDGVAAYHQNKDFKLALRTRKLNDSAPQCDAVMD